jgi:N-acetyltransferase 10
MSFLDAITEKSLRSTVSLTAARGRGKSAAIGICLAGAVAYGYSNIFVTAPSPENLKSVFEFLIAGLNAVKFKEHIDYEVLTEHRGEEGGGSVVTRINIFREHRQTVQYILPTDHAVLAQAELLAIDEAAAIPLPVVQKLLGPYLVFLSSTVNGYEGTGRALSLKLIQQLRQQQGQAMARHAMTAAGAVTGSKEKKGQRKVHEERWRVAAETAASGGGVSGRTLTELTLETPIRYGKGDAVEHWLNQLLCLDSSNAATRLVSVMPAPRDCELYLVDRDALFSYHAMAEGLLQRIWSLYTSAHYKNTPNDLQMLSDAPAHRLFVLLGPRRESPRPSANGGVVLPDILCVVQVAFEGRISAASVQAQMARSNKASGDLIPWTISQQFNDNDFATLSGARIVRVATHPDVQGMGYGTRALELLIAFFQGRLGGGRLNYGEFQPEGQVDGTAEEGEEEDEDEYDESISRLRQEKITQKKRLPPLLIPLADRPAERLDWIGVSYGLTSQLHNFWSKREFKLCYLRQTINDLTGEHSAIMLRELDSGEENHSISTNWVGAYVEDYRKRIVSLLSLSLRSLPSSTALSLIVNSSDSVKLTGQGGHTAENELEEESSSTVAAPPAVSIATPLTASELTTVHFSHHDLKRLELYSRNMVDHHMILDMVPLLAKLYYHNRFSSTVTLSPLQNVILLSVGLQHKTVDEISLEVNLPVNQILAFFNKTIRKLSSSLREIVEADISSQMLSNKKRNALEMRANQMIQSSLESLESDQQADEKLFHGKAQSDKVGGGGKNKSSSSAEVDHLLIESLHRGIQKQNQIPKTISIAKERTPPAAGGEEAAGKRKPDEKKKHKASKKSRKE